MTPTIQLVVTLIGGLGGLAGVGALVNAIFSRGKTRAEAAQVITGAAVVWMNEFEEEAKAAREEAKVARGESRAARAEARAARTELRTVRDEARALADDLHTLRTAIMSPDATVDSLRLLVAGSGGSGRHDR